MGTLGSHIHPPKSGNKPTSMVIMLHGYGANGKDLIDLAPYFTDALPDTVFIAPDAPQSCEMMPVGQQWFPLSDWSAESMLSGVQSAAPVVDNFITEQAEKYSIPFDKIALLGFSQGTMVSLYTGPRYPEQLAGILGYSGALVWEDDAGPELIKLPVHLIHGGQDAVVPVAAYNHAKECLEAAGFEVSGMVFPHLTHGVDEGCVNSGAEFLKTILT